MKAGIAEYPRTIEDIMERLPSRVAKKRGPYKKRVRKMPDPKKLQVGDRIRFVRLPEEWSRPGFGTPRDSVAFMKAMIRRRFPSRIYKIDDTGYPWIAARMWRRGRCEHHTWGIFEATGWRKVRRRD